MKGLNEFLEALEGFDYSEKEKPDYCLYYDDAGKIYEASPEEREELSYIKVPWNWPENNFITDWTVEDGKLKPIEKHSSSASKYRQVTHASELDHSQPVLVTEKDHRLIKHVIDPDQVMFNRDESYYQFQ